MRGQKNLIRRLGLSRVVRYCRDGLEYRGGAIGQWVHEHERRLSAVFSESTPVGGTYYGSLPSAGRFGGLGSGALLASWCRFVTWSLPATGYWKGRGKREDVERVV